MLSAHSGGNGNGRTKFTIFTHDGRGTNDYAWNVETVGTEWEF